MSHIYTYFIAFCRSLHTDQFCTLYRWQLWVCLPWTMSNSVLFTGDSSSSVYHGQWLALCPLYMWQLQLCLPWTMTSSVLFTCGSSRFVYNGQWLVLSYLHVVALGFSTMDNCQLCPLSLHVVALCLSTMDNMLVLSSLYVIALGLSTMDNGQLCPLYRWQLQLCLLWTMTSSVLFTGGSSRFVYHGYTAKPVLRDHLWYKEKVA